MNDLGEDDWSHRCSRCSSECAQILNDTAGALHLRQGGVQLRMQRVLQLSSFQAVLHLIDGIKYQEPDIVQWIIQLVSNTGGQLAQAGQF